MSCVLTHLWKLKTHVSGGESETASEAEHGREKGGTEVLDEGTPAYEDKEAALVP